MGARARLFGLAGLSLLLGSPAAPGGAPVVIGWARSAYDLAPGREVPAYRNNGFAQEVVNGKVVVTVRASDSWSRAAFDPAVLPPAEDKVARFAGRAAGGARTRAEAVAAVLQSLSASIRYRKSGVLAERGEEVLAAGEASCVGMSNLAVQALAALQIEARIVRGLWIDPTTGESVPHRWIEIFYPDGGWVFSDPTESVNYVANHVVLTSPERPDPDYDPRRAAELGLRRETRLDRMMAVDLRPSSPGGLGERRARPAQFASALVGFARPALAGHVRLVGRGLSREQPVPPGRAFSFPGLDAGEYALEATFGDEVQTFHVRLADAEVVQLEVNVR